MYPWRKKQPTSGGRAANLPENINEKTSSPSPHKQCSIIPFSQNNRRSAVSPFLLTLALLCTAAFIVVLLEENSPHINDSNTNWWGWGGGRGELNGNNDVGGITDTEYLRLQEEVILGLNSRVTGGDGSDNHDKKDSTSTTAAGELLRLGNIYSATTAPAAATLPDHFAYPWVWGLRAAGSYGGNEDAELLAELPLGRQSQPLAEEAFFIVGDSKYFRGNHLGREEQWQWWYSNNRSNKSRGDGGDARIEMAKAFAPTFNFVGHQLRRLRTRLYDVDELLEAYGFVMRNQRRVARERRKDIVIATAAGGGGDVDGTYAARRADSHYRNNNNGDDDSIRRRDDGPLPLDVLRAREDEMPLRMNWDSTR